MIGVCSELPKPPVIGGGCSGQPDILLEGENATHRLLRTFVAVYPEFIDLLDNESNICKFYSLLHKIKCTTYRYECISDLHICECKQYEYFLLIAHYIVISNLIPGLVTAALPVGGTISSASLGDASVSYDTTAESRMVGNSFYKRFLWSTNYGKEYLAMISKNTGLLTIN